MKPSDSEYLPLSHLNRRGWTPALIRRFLGKPDQEKTNPRFASAPPMKLYEKQRVEQAEGSSEFKGAQASRKGRREAAQKGLDTKRKKIDAYVEQLEIEVPQLEREELIQRACDHYNIGRFDDNRASPDSDVEFLERICVNYLRHCLTSYEDHLDEITGKVGAPYASLEIKEKVLEKIGEAYEWLADECSRQESRTWEQEMQRISGDHSRRQPRG